MIIRTATIEDAPTLLNIYKPYVENTAVSFEYNAPTIDEFKTRIENTLKKYPYIVAEEEGKILGYCYVSQFKTRPAFSHSVETSIYIEENSHKKGVGKALYLKMEELLIKQNITNMNACIIYPRKKDPYLTKDSYHFHKKMGYRKVAEFTKCGYKFNRWYNMIWMEKIIGEHKKDEPSFIPFPLIK